jgi:predicted ABC-type ATPase
MLPIKFQSIWLSSFRKDFFEINQVKTRIACGGHEVKEILKIYLIEQKDISKSLR